MVAPSLWHAAVSFAISVDELHLCMHLFLPDARLAVVFQVPVAEKNEIFLQWGIPLESKVRPVMLLLHQEFPGWVFMMSLFR